MSFRGLALLIECLHTRRLRTALAGPPAFLPRYLERHPYLEEFAASPSCAYYRIRVRSHTLVSIVSVLNVAGTGSILEQVKRVWASLWSDAALLYRQELHLEVERSAMAGLVQRFVPGDCSGVIFSQSPLEAEVAELYATARRAESLFGGPQDVEWTFGAEGLRILQSRLVTAKKQDPQEKRVWNLSLRRSFENLSAVRQKIEESISSRACRSRRGIWPGGTCRRSTTSSWPARSSAGRR